MSSPIDLPDFITTVGAPPPQLLKFDALDGLPFTSTPLPVTPWQSIELVLTPFNAGVANNVITATLTWRDGSTNSVVWVDKYTLWSSQAVGVNGADVRIVVPVRGSSVVLSLASNGAGDGVAWFMFGTSRVVVPRIQCDVNTAGPHLAVANAFSLAAGASTDFRVGPVSRRVSAQLTAHVTTFTVALYAEVPAVVGLIEASSGFATAIVGTPGTVAELMASQMAARVHVTNTGAGVANFDLVVLGDYQ